MKQLLRSKGFTLIELMMVIVILGILAAVAVPKFADISGNANIAVFNRDMTAINGGIQIQRATNLIADPTTRGYPVDLDGLGSGVTVDVFITPCWKVE